MGVSNVSSREMTIKNMFSIQDSDNYTIDKILYYCNFKDTRDDTESIICFGNILDNYRDYFEKYLVDADVPEAFYYQPAAFAENYYGTPDLDFIVLYFAKMTSLFEFKKPIIKALPPSRILELNRLFVEYKNQVKESYNSPTQYIKK